MIDLFTGEYFGNTVYQYLLFLGIVIVFLVVAKILNYFITFVLKKYFKKTKNKLDDIIILSIGKPILFFTFIIGLFVASKILTLPESIQFGYGRFLKMLFEFFLAWVIISFIDALIIEYLEPLTKKTESDLDDHLLPFVRTLAKTSIIVIAAIMVLSDLGFNVTAIIAGLGIGGLAIGLAAKDFASNLFGGIVLIMDKPFTVGNKIIIGKEKGKVRNISLRFTELEAEDNTKIVIPNSKFVGNPIYNLSYSYKKGKK
jgi:MscS family membrane protein